MKVVKAGKLIKGIESDAISNPYIFINKDGQITEVREEDIELKSSLDVIDWSPYTVMPGLINSHTHLSLTPKLGEGIMDQIQESEHLLSIRAFLNVIDDLQAGITTERCLGDIEGLEIELRDSIKRGELPGPRLYVCSKPLRPTHGGGTSVNGTDGVYEVRKAVREAIFQGANLIKIFATNIRPGKSEEAFRKGDLTRTAAYTEEEIRTAVEEAHRADYKVAAHAFGGPALRWCLEAGVDTIEHANNMEEKFIDLFKETGAFISDPNLQGFFDNDTGFESRENWNKLPDWWRNRVLSVREQTKEVLAKALKQDVKFALGTDSNHGRLWREALHFVSQLGGTEMQAIQAVTLNCAEAIGISDKLGSVEEGKIADLIAIAGDPLNDISDLKNVEYVMKNGEIINNEIINFARYFYQE